MKINHHQYMGFCIFFLSFFLFETCSISGKAIGSFYESSANVTRCPTIKSWLSVFEGLPPWIFFWHELVSSLSGPKSRYEVTFSSSVLCCLWGCCQVSSGQETGWSWGQKVHRPPELEHKALPCDWEGTSDLGEKEEEDGGGNSAGIFPWRWINVLIVKCCILGTKPVSRKDFYFFNLWILQGAYNRFLALQTKAINKCNLLHEWFISAQFKFRAWFILLFWKGPPGLCLS